MLADEASGPTLVIAIDGPSGSGKSTVARRVARALQLRYLDTGAIYRALTWAVLDRGVDSEDVEGVLAVAGAAEIRVSTDPQTQAVSVDERDVAAAIRGPAVTRAVSAVSAIPQVRERLVALQRALIGAGGIVVEGRDIGTVVSPDAAVKIFLTASAETRAARRSADADIAGGDSDVGAVKADLARRDTLDSTRATSPLAMAPDAVPLDSTTMDEDAVVARVLDLVAQRLDSDSGDSESADSDSSDGETWDSEADWVGLDDTDDDEVEVDIPATGIDDYVAPAVPVVAIVGRPNVGKSTLVNRILGRREAVVEDVPGVTRDRVMYDANWRGRAFTIVDTGGWEPAALGLQAQVSAQAEIGAFAAQVVVMVVDATVGATDTDEAVARVLRKARKPVVLVANKVDTAKGESDASSLWSLGLGEPYAVSALHGRGSGELLDAIFDALPEPPPEDGVRGGGPRRVALLGRPNVGKSSLLNKVSGEDRSVVDSVAGTTRDPVDSLVTLGGVTWRFIDTAGIRRRVREASGAEYYSSLRTATALREAEVAVVLLDASEPLAEQDLRIIEMVVEEGRALVLAFNKWDIVDEDRHDLLEKEIDRQLHHVAWAPRVNVSAKTGRAVDKLTPAIELALDGWSQRVPTSKLNAWLSALIAATPPPVRGGRQPKVLFATQAGTQPPRFVLFSSGFLEATYRRFIERRLREDFGFPGTPVEVAVRVKESRKGRPRGVRNRAGRT
jgi:GTPase